MSIERSDFDSITESDLQELIEAQVPESLRLEFKRQQYEKTDKDKLELLKDISALANTHGGHLLLGVEENEGIATELVGLEIDADKEKLRIEQIIKNGTEPPIPGIRQLAISLSTEKKVILIRIPPSWFPPHRVRYKGKNRFYMRNSAGVHEPSVEELRAVFNQTATALEQAHNFRDERIRKVCEGRGPKSLKAGGRLFLHIVPVAAFSGMVNIDVKQVSETSDAFKPFGALTGIPKPNFDGFIIERGDDLHNSYTQIFRNGALEATMDDIAEENNGRRTIHGLVFETKIFELFSLYINGLRDIGVPTPLIIMFSLEGVKGVHYDPLRNANYYSSPPLLPEPILTLPVCIIEEYGSKADHESAVQRAFDPLWAASGHLRAASFDGTDGWIGERDL